MQNSNSNIAFEELIIKFLDGNCSSKEEIELFNWVESSSLNRERYKQLKLAWSLTSKGERCSIDIKEEWQKVSRSINADKKKIRISSFIKRYVSIAAAMLIGVVSTYLIKDYLDSPAYSDLTTISIPKGQYSTVTLPDGSTVLLNSGSTLKYDSNYSRGNRNLIIDGEGYFEVAKDPNNPFIVQTQTVNVTVYGTKFNVYSYQNEAHEKITLIEGSIGLTSKGSEKEFIRMKPNQQISIDNSTNSYYIKEVNTERYTSWKEGYISFDNETLKQIAQKMERWYNVEIIIEDLELEKRTYIGTILRGKPIDEILEVLRLTSGLEYRIEPKVDAPSVIYWN